MGRMIQVRGDALFADEQYPVCVLPRGGCELDRSFGTTVVSSADLYKFSSTLDA